jgi:hypothetical protein
MTPRIDARVYVAALPVRHPATGFEVCLHRPDVNDHRNDRLWYFRRPAGANPSSAGLDDELAKLAGFVVAQLISLSPCALSVANSAEVVYPFAAWIDAAPVPTALAPTSAGWEPLATALARARTDGLRDASTLIALERIEHLSGPRDR